MTVSFKLLYMAKSILFNGISNTGQIGLLLKKKKKRQFK